MDSSNGSTFYFCIFGLTRHKRLLLALQQNFSKRKWVLAEICKLAVADDKLASKVTASKHPMSKCRPTVARTILLVIGDLQSGLMTNSRKILFEEICVRPTTGVFVAEQDLSHSPSLTITDCNGVCIPEIA